MKDALGREIDYLRVSVTDRCNLRCRYCMPEHGLKPLPGEDILSFDEIVRAVEALAGLGVRRVRLTGGEPLCRAGLPELVGRLRQIDGVEEVALTTNGILLLAQAEALRLAGIERVNVSLDSLRPERYAAITRGGKLSQALAGIDAAKAAGLRVKINMVPVRAVNDDEILDFIAFGRQNQMVVRFIELMPVGLGAGMEGVGPAAILETIGAAYPGFTPFRDGQSFGPAECFGWPEGGVFGVIAAVHHRFCAGCNRVRLTADGRLRLCLGQADALDLKPYLRQGQAGLEDALLRAVYHKPVGHDFEVRAACDRTMNQIGG